MHEWLDSWSGLGLIAAGMTHSAPGSLAHGVLRARLAREFLPDRYRALNRGRLSVGADTVPRGAASGVGGDERADDALMTAGESWAIGRFHP
jgi:hypothetical protein